ncbi:hypothetical protein Hanom_Chr15g01361841 [Helianthus anomalus]
MSARLSLPATSTAAGAAVSVSLISLFLSLSLARTTTRQTPPRHRRLRWSPMMEMWVILVVELKQKGWGQGSWGVLV